MHVNLFRYGGVYVAVLVALIVVGWLLARFTSVGIPSGLNTVLPPMMAALMEGQAMAKRSGVMMPSGAMWRSAVAMTAVVAAINMVILFGLSMIPGFADLFNAIGFGLLGGIFLFLLVMVFFTNRIFLWFGQRNTLKTTDVRVLKK
ncbi:ABZJ_00895 family protein [Vannielia sp.]|uniref:ABZJ_00895 family protein n=1 Tax=Vannielia sp. TaxID=2813045 RepID=UPI002626C9FB|nr:ABZJ_00895 family protein [Vannielia sp.]MDF1872166.1 ABZJ_00895 family protein [Vannielia sp.]